MYFACRGTILADFELFLSNQLEFVRNSIEDNIFRILYGFRSGSSRALAVRREQCAVASGNSFGTVGSGMWNTDIGMLHFSKLDHTGNCSGTTNATVLVDGVRIVSRWERAVVVVATSND